MLAIACIAALASCATAPVDVADEEIDPLSGSPSDFSLEVTVLAPLVPEAAANVPVPAQLRQSRYVLFADGELHQGLDPDHKWGADWLPPITRILSRRELAELWSLAQQIGFTDPKAGSPAVNFKLVKPGPDEIVTLAGFSGNGKRWFFERRQKVGSAEDPAMTQLVRRLAQLSWASDRAEPETLIVPHRYNFGPDPYARYRTGAATAPMGK